MTSLLELFYAFMQSMPSMGLWLVCSALVAWPLLLVHEMGHAWAARRFVGGDVEVTLGAGHLLAEAQLGAVKLRLGLPVERGSATFDGHVTARDALLIALAGPLASAAGLVVCAVLYAAGPHDGFIGGLSWSATLGSLFGVLNLVPLTLVEGSGGRTTRSDGAIALDALRAMRGDVPRPGGDAATGRLWLGMRWPFALVLASIIATTGFVLEAWELALSVASLFFGAYLLDRADAL